jgi:hypothetical protein
MTVMGAIIGDIVSKEFGPFCVLEKSLPPLYSTRGLRYDEICVHLKCSVEIENNSSAPRTWSWYVLEGQTQPDGNWLLWGFVSAKEKDFREFTLRHVEAVAESWRSKIKFDSDVQPKILSRIMENLGIRWHDSS